MTNESIEKDQSQAIGIS